MSRARTRSRLSSYAALLVGSASLAVPAAQAQGSSAHRPLVIGVLSFETGEGTAPDSVSRNAERGLLLGIEEARETARLFGREVRESRTVIKRGDDAVKAARIMARTTNMSALLVTNPELIPAAESVAHPGYAVIVLRTLAGGALDCSKFVFAVYPPTAEIDSARAMLLRGPRQVGVASARGALSPAGARVAIWTPALERFGALELNDRYRARWKSGMTSEGWATWVAVKILSEAALRRQTNEPFLLLDYITKSEFDGHKGWPLTFRATDHLLRQPIYIVSAANGAPLTEAPAGGRSETESAEAMLDRVLPPRPNQACNGR